MSFLTPEFDSTEAELRTRQSDSASGRASVMFLNSGLIGRCANLYCRSSWLHLFRKRSAPVFEGGWTCSPECTEARMVKAFHRELNDYAAPQEMHRHRIPLGLLMLEQGWITHSQLREALQSQRASGSGRLGDHLIRQGATDEKTVTRALGLQWSCPVLLTESQHPAVLVPIMPRLFVDAFGALPLHVAGGRLLYLGFEQCLDPVLAFSISRMTGLQVECGIVPFSMFVSARERMLTQEFPPVQLAEAVSESAAASLLARCVERVQPAAARLVRVHECVWLRMWHNRQAEAVPRLTSVSDVICSLACF